MGAAGGLSPRAPCKGCPADTGVQALQDPPTALSPGDPPGWKRAGRERHLRQQRAVPAGSLPLWKGMLRAGWWMCLFPSALGRWQGARLVGEKWLPAAKFP